MVQKMFRLVIYAVLLWVIPFRAFSQAPPIQWQRTIGGSGDDRLSTLQQTSDGGYIAAGFSGSGVSGEKTEPNRGEIDFWIIKLSASGAIEWQKTYGTAHYDHVFSIIQASDGGYLAGGYSLGDVSGDKTEPNRGTAGTFNLGYDIWIMKLTPLGNIQWQRTYGANGNDLIYSLFQRNNASFIVGGISEWHPGLPNPRTPDRTTINHTWNDRWMLKLDVNTGAIQHQEAHGGNRHDNLFTIIPTKDGGYISTGVTQTPGATGNKTINGWGVWPDSDNWVIKMDSNFAIQWQTVLGGTADDWSIGGISILRSSGEGGMEQTADSGYIVGHDSRSGISGNKTVASYGGMDWWIVKLDKTGAISWQKALGGSGEDVMGGIIATSDGGYFAAGTSNSPISGDKSEASRGDNDFWIVKMDASRNIEWQKTLGGSGDDGLTVARKTSDGGYILGGFSNSNASGEKSENSRGNYDFWIIKLGKCDTTINRTDSFCIGTDYRLPGGNLVSIPGIYTDTLQSSRSCDSIIITTLSYIQDTVHQISGTVLGNDTTFCEGQSLTLHASYPGATSYLWNTGATGSSINVTRTDNYWVEVTSSKGCKGRDSIYVLVSPGPVVDLGDDKVICGIDDVLTLGSSQPAGARYLWSNGLSSSEIRVMHAGKYWLQVTMGDCIGSDTILVKLIKEPEVNVGLDSIICTQYPLRIGTEIPGASYLWSTGETTSYIHVSSTNDYVLEVNIEGCLWYDTVHITAMPVPEIDLGSDRYICTNDTILLDASFSGKNSYVWNTGDTGAVYAAAEAGMYAVSVTTEYHCTGSDTILLTFHPKPVISLGPDTTVCEETPLLLVAKNINTDSLIWSDGSVGEMLSVKYGGTYIATGINRCGTGADTIEIKQIFCDIWVPNAFTPNGDGANDLFRVLGNLGRLEGFGFGIYDRWGQRVFYTRDKYQGWDGYYKSVPAQLGTYIYMLEYTIGNTPYLQKGNFHLLR